MKDFLKTLTHVAIIGGAAFIVYLIVVHEGGKHGTPAYVGGDKSKNNQ